MGQGQSKVPPSGNGSKSLGSRKIGAGTSGGGRAGHLLSGKTSVGEAAAGVGRGRGVIGGGTPDPLGRLPTKQRAPGNFGGGFAYKDRRLARDRRRG
jgi:hypothetical protein